MQKEKIKKVHEGKSLKDTVVYIGANEEELYQAILVAIDSEVIEAEFDSEEEAATIGLRIDAKGKGNIGVGIQGKLVHFWPRQI